MSLRKEEIREIMDSGLLESYALGLTDQNESVKVMEALKVSDELRVEFDLIQQSFEDVALSGAVSAPPSLKSSILDAIAAVDSVSENSEQSLPEPARAAQTSQPKSGSVNSAVIKRMNRMVVAASVAAFLFAAVAVSEWFRASEFEAQNALLTRQVEQLRGELEGEQLKFASLESEYKTIDAPETGKYTLIGNEKAPGFMAVAYWNDESQASYLRVVEQPSLGDDEVLQLWADVHGEMVSLGVIQNTSDLVALDFKIDAESLNVTIEPTGGSEHPNVSRLVASIPI